MSADIAERILRYLERQEHWVAMRQAELKALEARMDDEDVQEALDASQERREREIETFVREQEVLLREWHALSPPPTELAAAIRARAEACGRELEALSALAKRLGAMLAERKQDSSAELGTLRKGRGALRSYTGEQQVSRDIDRQA